ncbi:SRPBCC domain-containing protein [Lutimaribacter marinistellae]|uniref:SRPBCC domain-containing protein n=1 Tax=Lutimaribacter marinistellae TaxID=1820329 RepID=A0ABV7T9F9_9RHOB
MTDLTLSRRFPVPPERLFEWVTRPERILKWWGPEGMTVPESDIDFTRTGPWSSVMANAEGQRFKVSGHVTHVDPPRSVGFTWAWHDESDRRGDESHVTLTVTAAPEGAQLTIDHRDLAADTAEHEAGWTSTLNKLTALLDT